MPPRSHVPPPPPPRRTTHRSRRPNLSHPGVWIGLAAAAAVVVGLVAWNLVDDGSSNGATDGTPAVDGRVSADDPELQIVRAWLRENLPSGRWEEIRWWPMRPLKKQRELQILFFVENERGIRDNPGLVNDLRQEREELLRTPIPSGCVLKYRTTGEDGHIGVYHVLFVQTGDEPLQWERTWTPQDYAFDMEDFAPADVRPPGRAGRESPTADVIRDLSGSPPLPPLP